MASPRMSSSSQSEKVAGIRSFPPVALRNENWDEVGNSLLILSTIADLVSAFQCRFLLFCLLQPAYPVPFGWEQRMSYYQHKQQSLFFLCIGIGLDTLYFCLVVCFSNEGWFLPNNSVIFSFTFTFGFDKVRAI